MEKPESYSPLVSVIVPVYNGSNFIKAAIESIAAQDYENIEIIVVNDGSTDNGATERIVLGLGLPNLRYIKKDNGGVATALNVGIEASQGEFISWLSHDDLLAKNKIRRQVLFLRRLLKKNKSIEKTILYGDTVLIDEKGRKHSLLKQLLYHKGRGPFCEPADFFRIGCLFYGSLLLPRSFFKDNKFVENLKYSQDSYSFFQMLAAGYQLLYCPRSVVKYRIHKQQGSFVRLEEYDNDCQLIYQAFVGYFNETGDMRFFRGYLFYLARKGAAFPANLKLFNKLMDEHSQSFCSADIRKARRTHKIYGFLYKIKRKIIGR